MSEFFRSGLAFLGGLESIFRPPGEFSVVTTENERYQATWDQRADGYYLLLDPIGKQVDIYRLDRRAPDGKWQPLFALRDPIRTAPDGSACLRVSLDEP